MLQFGSAEQEFEVALWRRPYSDQLNVECLEQTKLTAVAGSVCTAAGAHQTPD